MLKRLAIIPFLFLCSLATHAQTTVTAASCSRTDVNAVINGPTHTAISGDKIIIPACASTSWASGIAVTVGIDITGSGTPNTGAGTVGAGTSTTTLAIAPNNSFFTFSGLTVGETAKVELLNLNSTSPSTVGGTGDFTLQFVGTCTSGGCAQVRVDNITYGTDNWEANLSDGGFIGSDGVYGVLDHNTANESGSVGTGVGDPFIQLAYSAWLGVGANGDNSFAAADTFGTASAMYLENNSFNYVRGTENDVAASGAGGAQGAPRYVCRFNTYLNMSGTGICSGHGTGWIGRLRGQRQIEVYHNNVTTVAANGCDAVMGILSGTGYFFSNFVNTASVGCNKFVSVSIARFIMTTTPWNSCDGTQPWDQVPFTSSSVCLDSPGRGGLGALLQGTTPVLASAPGTPCTTAGQCYPGAPLDPIYEAADTSSPQVISPGIVGSDGIPAHANINVDFYGEVSQTAQTSATSPFNGTTGTGYGTFARRPITCTTGVVYDATDQGTWNNGGAGDIFYKCTSPNVWTLLYTPYTYPHPLDGGVAPSPPAPAAIMMAGEAIQSGSLKAGGQ